MACVNHLKQQRVILSTYLFRDWETYNFEAIYEIKNKLHFFFFFSCDIYNF